MGSRCRLLVLENLPTVKLVSYLELDFIARPAQSNSTLEGQTKVSIEFNILR